MKPSRLRNNKLFFILCLTECVLLSGCRKNPQGSGLPEGGPDSVTTVVLSCDKARYDPGSTAHFQCDPAMDASIEYRVRYRHLDSIVHEESVTGNTWSWTVPGEDFRGYLVELYAVQGTDLILAGSTGLDVSSRWTRFPRYGFLSSFGALKQEKMAGVIDNLCRFHINGIQYYDWHCDHHRPLAGTVEQPAGSWPDIGGRTQYKATVEEYISLAREKNMASMFYDLCYGVLTNGAADGVKEEWYIFTDRNHLHKDVLELSPPFRSPIYLTDPSNPFWLDYFSARVADVYCVYDFDGFHIDQLGERGARYDYNGGTVDMARGYGKFLNRMNSDYPQKTHVFNAVAGYGQQSIAWSGADFLYNEVWSNQSSYADLKNIIDLNAYYSGGKLNTVLAAYMNYDKANTAGTFNTPGVLMTEAVIFASGGSHLELGEHMLCKEYFPNNNLSMDKQLSIGLVSYYDFLVAYENLLRDGGSFNEVSLNAVSSSFSVDSWPPRTGKVIYLAKQVGNRQVIHLLNYSNAISLSWRDLNGEQPEQRLIRDAVFRLITTKNINKIWAATPDPEGAKYRELEYTQGSGYVTFTVPVLNYWTMVVIQ